MPKNPDKTPELAAPSASEADPAMPVGPGFAATFLYYFLGTALVTTLLATQTLGLAVETGIPTQFGLLLGAVGGLLGALTNRSGTLLVPCSSEKKIKQQLDALLNDMGYSEDSEASTDDILVYGRPVLRQAFSGKVYLLIKNNQAQIRSRATHLRAIRKRLEKAGLKVAE